MAGFTSTIKPGNPQQVTGAPLDKGAIVYNNDTANAVWIGDTQSVSPGNGMYIGPFGSANWTGKQLWACVDTGVVSPVIINASTDMTQLNNPVGIATAVAIALLASGIPNVLVETVLFSSVVGLAGNTGMIDAHSQASLVVSFRTGPGGVSTLGVSWLYEWFDITGTLISSGELSIAPSTPTNTPVPGTSFEMPVTGHNVRFTNNSPGALGSGLQVVGSNRPCDNTHRLTELNAITALPALVVAPFVAGTQYNLGLFKPAGLSWIEGIITGTVVKGGIYLQDFSANTIDVIDTTEMTTLGTNQSGRKLVVLPQDYCMAIFNCQTGGAGSVILRGAMTPQ